MMWRNLVNYLPVQGVDEVYDQNALMKRYPQAAKEITAWGVPDDYAYRLAQTLLRRRPSRCSSAFSPSPITRLMRRRPAISRNPSPPRQRS